MPVLRININGRYYDITCEKNKEKYVLELSKYFNEKVKISMGPNQKFGIATPNKATIMVK